MNNPLNLSNEKVDAEFQKLTSATRPRSSYLKSIELGAKNIGFGTSSYLRDIELGTRFGPDYIVVDAINKAESAADSHDSVAKRVVAEVKRVDRSQYDAALFQAGLMNSLAQRLTAETRAAATPDTFLHQVLREQVRKDHDARRRSRALSRAYRISWLVIGLLGMVWGYVAAASLVAGVGVTRTSAVFGLAAVVGLMATLFVAGRSEKKHGT